MVLYEPVTLEELRKLSGEEVVKRINDKIAPDSKNSGESESFATFSFPDFATAQFYMAELDRREKNRADKERDETEAKRWKTDLKYERLIVGLIIFEVLVSVVLFMIGGCQQSREAKEQITAIGKVKDELGELETSSEKTAATLGQVNDSLGLMNKKIQEQLNLEYEPSIFVSFVKQTPPQNVLTVHNYGHTSVLIYGVRIGGDACKQTSPVTISGGTEGIVGGNAVFKQISTIVGAGAGMDSVLYLKGEDGKEYEVALQIEAEPQTIGNGVRVHTYGLRSANWTRELEKAKPCFGVP
jgi:hypothetical protein